MKLYTEGDHVTGTITTMPGLGQAKGKYIRTAPLVGALVELTRSIGPYQTGAYVYLENVQPYGHKFQLADYISARWGGSENIHYGHVTYVYGDGIYQVRRSDGSSFLCEEDQMTAVLVPPKGLLVSAIIKNHEDLDYVTGTTTGTAFETFPYIKLEHDIGPFKKGNRVFVSSFKERQRYEVGEYVSGVATYLERYGRMTGTIVRPNYETPNGEDEWFIELDRDIPGAFGLEKGKQVFVRDIHREVRISKPKFGLGDVVRPMLADEPHHLRGMNARISGLREVSDTFEYILRYDFSNGARPAFRRGLEKELHLVTKAA